MNTEHINVTAILFWVLPPLAGAIIGYVTNAIAIKMLFRPLKEIRLAGFRLPFTPGILPRERRKLAASIGRMVENELLTSEVIRERLAKPEVREKIGNALGGYTDELLTRPLADWLAERPRAFHTSELFRDFVNSDVFDSFLDEIIRNWIGEKSSAPEQEETIGLWFKSRFRDLGEVFVPQVRSLIKNGLAKDMKNHEKGNPSFFRRALAGISEKYPGITLGEFLSLGEPMKLKVNSLLAEKAAGTLDENIERALASVNIKLIVEERIDSLDMIRVERIILDVMAGQLKWINFFGAILGAMIGFLEVLISMFVRP